jgi:hypothetical protein
METAPCDYSCLFLLHSQLTVDVVRGILWRLCQDDELTGSNPPWTKAGFTNGWMGIIGEIAL